MPEMRNAPAIGEGTRVRTLPCVPHAQDTANLTRDDSAQSTRVDYLDRGDQGRIDFAAPTTAELHSKIHGYAVLVQRGPDTYRRRLYLSLDSAQRAKDRATERGEYAAVVLVRLQPVGGVIE